MPDGSWVATHEDITELTANRQIVDERISLQALIDWVPDYLWVKDTESRFVVVNSALAADSGRDKTSDMIGLTDFDLHAPELAQKFRLIEQRVLQQRTTVDRRGGVCRRCVRRRQVAFVDQGAVAQCSK